MSREYPPLRCPSVVLDNVDLVTERRCKLPERHGGDCERDPAPPPRVRLHRARPLPESRSACSDQACEKPHTVVLVVEEP